MLCPIKINNSILPKFLLKILPNEYDIRQLQKGSDLSAYEFSRYIEAIYFEGKFSKTTMPHRHTLSDNLIEESLSKKKDAIILDVGASDGSTSLDLIKKLDINFSKYYVTDVSFNLHVMEEYGYTYFYDNRTKECIMIVNDNFIVYHDILSSSIIGFLAKYLIKKAPKYSFNKIKEINLCQPELQRLVKVDNRVILIEWDIFQKWQCENPDLIKIANVLKPEIFSNNTIIKAIKNLKLILKPNSKIIVIENEEIERCSLYSFRDDKFKLLESINGGCTIDVFFKRN